MADTLKSLVEAFVLHRLQSLNLDKMSLSTSRNHRSVRGAPAAHEIQALAMAWLRELATVEPDVSRFGVLCHTDMATGFQFSIIGIEAWNQLEEQAIREAQHERTAESFRFMTRVRRGNHA